MQNDSYCVIVVAVPYPRGFCGLKIFKMLLVLVWLGWERTHKNMHLARLALERFCIVLLIARHIKQKCVSHTAYRKSVTDELQGMCSLGKKI